MVLITLYYYKPKIVDKKFNSIFNENIKTSDTLPIMIRDQVAIFIGVPLVLITIILVLEKKLIVKILKKIYKPLLFHLSLFMIFTMSLFYFILFYASDFLVITF